MRRVKSQPKVDLHKVEKLTTNSHIRCTHCKEFSGWTNDDIRYIPQDRVLNCKECGKPCIKLLCKKKILESDYEENKKATTLDIKKEILVEDPIEVKVISETSLTQVESNRMDDLLDDKIIDKLEQKEEKSGLPRQMQDEESNEPNDKITES